MRPYRILQIVFVASLVALLAGPGGADGESQADALWQPVLSHLADGPAVEFRVRPRKYRAFVLDRGRMDAALDEAPSMAARVPPAPEDGAVITLPMPDGRLLRFRVVEDPILAPELAAAFPDIHTYTGRGVDVPEATARITWTSEGLHAVLFTPEGTMYVDPLYARVPNICAAFARADLDPEEFTFVCHPEEDAQLSQHLSLPGGPAAVVTTGANTRTYRLAVSTTGAYTTWANNTGTGVMNEVTAAVNAVNAILLRDVAISLQLVANTNLLFYTTATDPYTSTWPPTPEVHTQITAVIGTANFDIGHLFVQGNFGGSALPSSVCSAASKGRGRSSSTNPAGVWFQLVVAHEMGHQFSAGHTWNSDEFAAGQFSPTTAWEPGEGTTIMSYGDYGGTNHIPGTTRADYYHGGTVEQMVLFTTVGGGNCPTSAATTNTPPVVNAGADRTIPRETPFRLTATGSDVDAAANLTYTWEEMDPSPTQEVLTLLDDGAIPLFRSFDPSAETVRILPELQVLIDNDLFPATTTPGALGEQLPRTNRVMIFRATARDNQVGAGAVGGLDQDEVAITVDAATGPFQVTSPNGGELWDVDLSYDVTWDVAGTTGGAVNEANVNILLSIDGGFTYPFTLVANTPNDGVQSVSFTCAMRTTQARVMVEAASNIFFDISDADFEIADLTPPVVTCSVARRILFPTRGALVDVGFAHTVTDNCDPPGSFVEQITVRSDETHGAAPFSPDVFLVGPTRYLLRSDRDVRLNGRVYLFLVEAWDTSLNRGFECCTTVVPRFPTVSYLTSALLQASTVETECRTSSGATNTGAPNNLHP